MTNFAVTRSGFYHSAPPRVPSPPLGPPDTPLRQFYVMFNGHSWFVKEAAFFRDQGGLTEPWGKHWKSHMATDIEAARSQAAALAGKEI